MDGLIGDNKTYSLSQSEFIGLFNYAGDDRLSFKVVLTNVTELDTETHLGLLDEGFNCMTLQGSSDRTSDECEQARQNFWVGGSNCVYWQKCSYKERMIS